jgi:hypothetical protein
MNPLPYTFPKNVGQVMRTVNTQSLVRRRLLRFLS